MAIVTFWSYILLPGDAFHELLLHLRKVWSRNRADVEEALICCMTAESRAREYGLFALESERAGTGD